MVKAVFFSMGLSVNAFLLSAAPHASDSSGESDTAATSHHLVKYPRTTHLKNLGAATEDDVVASDDSAALFVNNGEVFIEEKVDGANIGFSLDPESGEIRIQGRGHFVTSATHAQFSTIDTWVQEHHHGLYTLLEEGGPGSVLYGEWLYATHSIHYKKLPDYFLAFDFFDGTDFLQRSEFHAKMRGTGIAVVPIIYKGAIGSITELLNFLQTRKSLFDDNTNIEGLMLRKENHVSPKTGKVEKLNRMKLVRGEFQQCVAEGRWETKRLLKQRWDYDVREDYLENCYSEADGPRSANKYAEVALPALIENNGSASSSSSSTKNSGGANRGAQKAAAEKSGSKGGNQKLTLKAADPKVERASASKKDGVPKKGGKSQKK